MAKLLYIEASPRKARSHSIKLAQEFIEQVKDHRPTLEIDVLDLWQEELPSFDGDVLDAKYELLSGGKPSSQQIAAWAAVTDIVNRFTSADIYVVSTPMWNFSIPYKLKHLIDVVAQPTYTYQASADIYSEWGLLTDKTAIVITARGGQYPTNTPLADWDFQTHYLTQILTFMGIKDVKQVAVELTAVEPETLPERMSLASTSLRDIAEKLVI